jgi:excisionase family DNA binding protein
MDGSAWRDPHGKPFLVAFGCPEGVRVGSGVSEAQAAFVTTPATVYGHHDDRALRLDRRCLRSRSWIIDSRIAEREGFAHCHFFETTGHTLRADELAHVLTVSRITIFKQAKAGRIPSFRIGTCVRFDPRTTAEWLRKQ